MASQPKSPHSTSRMSTIQLLHNPRSRQYSRNGAELASFDKRRAALARRFHASMPGYNPTSLHNLPSLAKRLGLRQVWLKDESQRFGLKAFKVLGASYATAVTLAEHIGLNRAELRFDSMQSYAAKGQFDGVTLTTATDGNHGRAVAWAAQQSGARAVIFMPRTTVPARVEAVRSHDAEVRLVDGGYDEAVRLARQDADRLGWLLIQDTSWDGYEQIPLLIMQGYLTMIDEALEQLQGALPTHVFLQCGVGSFPAAVLAHLTVRFGQKRPLVVIVEPTGAACVFESFRIGDGNLHTLSNEPDSIMAGLCCGTPSKLAWEILRDYADFFVACPDTTSVHGMRTLARPVGDDPTIISGESGAVTAGLLSAIR